MSVTMTTTMRPISSRVTPPLTRPGTGHRTCAEAERLHGHLWSAVPWRQVGGGVVPRLVIVVLHVEAGQLGEVDSQRAAAVVDVLTVQGLQVYTENVVKHARRCIGVSFERSILLKCQSGKPIKYYKALKFRVIFNSQISRKIKRSDLRIIILNQFLTKL